MGDFKTPQSGSQERDGNICLDQTGGPSDPVSCPSELGEDHIGGMRYGWTLGGGVEYAMDDKWSIRIEYSHSDFGTKHYMNPHSGGSPTPGDAWAKLTDERVSLGLNYRF